MTPLTEIDKDWLTHPATKDFKQQVSVLIEETKEEWAHGGFTSENTAGTIQQNAHALGMIRAYNMILEYFDNKETL